MDNRLKQILREVKFSDKYQELYEANKDAEKPMNISQEEKANLFEKLNLDVKYFKKEDFFQHKEQNNDFLCNLNIAISDSRIEFILFFQNEAIKLKDGGPYGLLAKRMNPKLPAFYKIPYSDKKNLLLNLKKGIALFEKVKEKVLKLN